MVAAAGRSGSHVSSIARHRAGPDDQGVGGGRGPPAHRKHQVGRLPELDGDRAGAAGEPLPRAEEERHPFPAPVVDHDLERGVGRGRRIRPDALRLAVPGHPGAVQRPGAVLAAHGVGGEIARGNRADGVQDLDLLVPHGVGLEGGGRLHGGEGEEREEVVLEHVAHHARLLVVTRAMLDAQGLRRGDLHVVDVVPVPHRLEDRVGEAEDQEVLDRLLPQVVIDPVHLGLGNLERVLLRGIGIDSVSPLAKTIPESLFMIYQMTFAIITVALVSGAVADRMRFSAFLLFSVLWLFVVYVPLAHWVWGGGFLQTLGLLDFAGGTVVHINAGIAGLVAALVLGKRRGYGSENLAPYDLSMAVVGTGLLWVGWFGFNGGSALAAGPRAAFALFPAHLPGSPRGPPPLALARGEG